MIREISAGGVVLREIEGAWHVALIEPSHRRLSHKKGIRQRRMRP